MKNPDSIPDELSRIAQLKRWSRISAVLGVMTLVAITLIAAWSLRQIDKTDYWVSHTYQVINTAHQLLFDLRDSQAAARSLMLNPDARYESAFQQSVLRIEQDLSTLGALTSDNASQQERLRRIEPLTASRISRIREVVMAAGSAAALPEAERIREEEQSRIDADQAWDLSREVQNAEYVLLGERQRQRQMKLRQGFLWTMGSSSLALIALLASTFQMRRAAVSLAAADLERREKQSMIASLFEAGPEAIAIVDEKGSILDANPEAQRLFGYDVEEIVHQPFKLLVPENWHVKFDEFRRRPIGGGNDPWPRVRLELPLIRKDQGQFYASVSIGRIHSSGEILDLAFISDLSHRHAQEEVLKAQAEQLRIVTGKLLTAQEDERRRIARNLHDDLNQSLAYLAMGLGNMANHLHGQESESALKSLQVKARESAELVRNISHRLHPAVLDDLGLEEAVRDLCDEFEEQTGAAVKVECDARLPTDASQDATACLYYVASECLRNVAKHAQATKVIVGIGVHERTVRLSIADDGKGMSGGPNRVYSGIGITTMRERLHLLGGSLTISPVRPRGTAVEVNLQV